MPDEQPPSSIVTLLKPQAKSQVSLIWHNWCRPLPSPVGSFKGTFIVYLAHSSAPLRINMTIAEVARCNCPLEAATLIVGHFRSPNGTN
jgi:hypothetical protein